MKKIEVSKFGPIRHAEVEFGDLTILVGAQASGKSLFLELSKLMYDKDSIISNLKKYNYILGKNGLNNLLDVYFGEGLSSLWKDKETSVSIDGQSPIFTIGVRKVDSEKGETIFYIPAQRILSMSDGRPKSFTEFDPSCPYVLRQFSETLRLFMAGGLGSGNNVLFPIGTRLKKYQRDSFDKSIFHGGKVVMDTKSMQRKMKLKVDGVDMPFMTWSAGQKEFMPLLMGFYRVSAPPSMISGNDKYESIIMEEPEMGLHPQAIKAIILQVLELMQRGYKVVLSTHSSIPLEFVWAFNILKQSSKKGREKALLHIFDKEANDAKILNGIFDKTIKTYYFTRINNMVESVDISSLDVGDDNLDISEWGGLSQFATETADMVSRFL